MDGLTTFAVFVDSYLCDAVHDLGNAKALAHALAGEQRIIEVWTSGQKVNVLHWFAIQGEWVPDTSLAYVALVRSD